MSRKVKMENVVRIFQQTILFFASAKKILKENNKEQERKREAERKFMLK
jgi:hypothetical protein